MYVLSFKQFLENSPDYFQNGMGDELGISWDNIKNIIEKEPWVAAGLSFGNKSYKLGSWEIVPGTLTQHGASIRLINKSRSYLSDKKLDKSDVDTTVYHLTREELEKFLTQGWTPAIQANAGM